MATIASLNVILSASTAQFSKGLNSARGQLSNFVSQIGSVRGALVGFSAALGIGAAVRAIKNLVGEQMEAIETTANLAERLGITTEALIGLRHAAQMSGSSGEALDSVLEKMTKSMGTAAAKAAALRLGLNPKKLANQSPAETFKDIAEAISRIESPFERARAAADFFGRSSSELINTLMLGRRGIEDMEKEAKKLGLTFDELAARKVMKANDALDRIKAVVTGIGSQLAIAVAPAIEALADQFTEAAVAGEGMASRVNKSLITLAKGIAVVADVVHALKLAWLGFDALFQAGVANQLVIFDLMLAAVQKIKEALGGKSAVLGVIENLRIQIAAAQQSAADAATAFKKAFEGQTPSEKLADIIAGMESAAMATDKAADRMAKYRQELDAVNNASKIGSTPAIERGSAAALTAELANSKQSSEPFKNFERHFLTQEQMDRQMLDLQQQQLIEIKKKPKVARF